MKKAILSFVLVLAMATPVLSRTVTTQVILQTDTEQFTIGATIRPETPARNVDRKATAEARQLLNRLHEVQAEQGSLSAMMSEYDWNHRPADRIADMTGHYPSINCYDFIHLTVPRSKEQYRSNTPVTEWAEAGGIVALMWHWNVPFDEGSQRMTFRNDGNFRAANCLQEGTWEHRVFYKDLDSVADIIGDLQSRHIPVIFRPFHEGSGNAQGTVWFWWGNGGDKVFKQLYINLYNYLTKTRKLHNIVWAWNSNIYQNGATYHDESWYPGDAYVDVVGTENYDLKEISQLRTCYDYLRENYPSKVIALTETNATFKVSEMRQAGIHWTYIMPWCGPIAPKKEWWDDYFTQPGTLTRER